MVVACILLIGVFLNYDVKNANDLFVLLAHTQ